VSRATPLLLRSRSTCFTPLLLSIPTRRAYARPIAAMLATEAFSTPATALASERTRATCTSSSKSCNKARRVWSTLHSFLPEPSGGSNHASIGRSLMPAQPLSPTMDSRLSVRPLAPTPNFPRRSITYTSNFTWKMRGSFRPEPARDKAVWLVDFHHVASHIQDACDVIDGKGSAAAQVRRKELCEVLKAYEDGAQRVGQRLRHYRRKARTERAGEELDSVIGYLDNNRARMAYKSAIDRKLPIATGPTEAAAKTLVGVRMKRSGARFSQHGGQTVLSLRAALKSRRFNDLMDILASSY